ncbi:MAG: outer membrane protein assembly factor BamE [Roseobacter sp.]
MPHPVTRRSGQRRSALLVALVVVASLSACSAQYSNHGYVPPREDLEQIDVGVDTYDSVIEALGSSASGSVLNENALFYVRSRVRVFAMLQPEVVDREVVAISFNNSGVVQNIERFGLERGNIVAFERRVTNSGVTDTPFLRQLLGNIGSFRPAGLDL